MSVDSTVPIFLYDVQSVLATWVAERIRDASPGRIQIVAAQEHDGPAVDREFRLQAATGLEHRGLEALLHAAAVVSPRGAVALGRHQRSPGWRRVHSAAYRWAGEHRGAALWMAQHLWPVTPTRYAKSSWVFLRLLALAFFVAFTSLGVQVRGLFGEQGIVPIEGLLGAASSGAGVRQFLRAPSVLWLNGSDVALVGVCGTGAVLAILLMAGVAQRASLGGLMLLYLSLVSVGAPFLSFQWDTMLIETAFLALFLAPAGLWRPRPVATTPWLPRWMLKWLLFRVMFLSGWVKVTSGDPTWRNFTALDFHLWSQPLPSAAAAWMAEHASGTLRAETAATLVIELVFPFLLFGNRPLRRIAVFGMLALLVGIAATGSYGFLGILTAALCLLVLDDRDWRWLGVRRDADGRERFSRFERGWRWTSGLALAWVFVATLASGWARARRTWDLPAPLRFVHGVTAPFMVANGYGMFEVMTQDRLEISVEGSDDGVHWRPYGFRYKPGDPARSPRYAAPHMPRLDWMMWFAALGQCHDSPWLFLLQQRLLEGAEPVRALFETDPFPSAPPQFMRTRVDRYRFAPSGSAAFWHTEPLGEFCPTVTLRNGRLTRANL